jgi:FtsZ-interacting cell division protein ZipA
MEPEVWIVIAIVALIVIGVAAYFVWANRRTERLKEQFGPEYDRMLDEREDRRVVESELEERRARREQLDIRPLDSATRQRYSSQWKDVQARFVDEPREAVREADELITTVMRDRGYPMDDFEQRAADISVDHPRVVENYRSAHDVFDRTGAEGSTEDNTEELRRAFVHYRALFAELLEEPQDERLKQAR